MKLKLMLIALVAVLCIVGCTERAQQKGVMGWSDPALATRQDIQDLKHLINERFDRLENPKPKTP